MPFNPHERALASGSCCPTELLQASGGPKKEFDHNQKYEFLPMLNRDFYFLNFRGNSDPCFQIFDYVGQLEMTFSNPDGQKKHKFGTAFHVNMLSIGDQKIQIPAILVTAAHNLGEFDPVTQKMIMAEKCEYFPGRRDSDDMDCHNIDMSTARLHPQYFGNHLEGFDIAIASLPSLAVWNKFPLALMNAELAMEIMRNELQTGYFPVKMVAYHGPEGGPPACHSMPSSSTSYGASAPSYGDNNSVNPLVLCPRTRQGGYLIQNYAMSETVPGMSGAAVRIDTDGALSTGGGAAFAVHVGAGGVHTAITLDVLSWINDEVKRLH